jgi:signal transduction histidine kinase
MGPANPINDLPLPPAGDDILFRSRILIIDDEEVNVRLLKRILEFGGFKNIVSTTDSRETLALFQDVRPDLILTDWLMPHLDGFAVVGQLSQLIGRDEFLPIVVLTADVTPQAMRRALAIGATDFLVKPIDAVEVTLRVGNLLKARRAHLKIREQNAVLEETVHQRTLHLEQTLVELGQGNLKIREQNAVLEETVHQRTLHLEQTLVELRQGNAEIEAARESATRYKSEFLSNITHELRTPMNGVIGMADLLLQTQLDPVQNEFAEVIRESADSMMTVINDVLDFSKIEVGRLSFEILDFDLIEMIESTEQMLAQRALNKGIQLAIVIAPDVPARLRADPRRLRQILTNLIGNALKFTFEGKVVVRISKESETAREAKIRFEVEDSGIGISLEAQDRLFQAFSQADGSTTRKYGGTGLGLAIAMQLVALMKGKIGVRSEPGKGSTFWFTAQMLKQLDEPEAAMRLGL